MTLIPQVKVVLEQEALTSTYDPKGVLDRYWELLMAENAQVNLVSRETSRADFDRLASESLLPLDYVCFPEDEKLNYLDVGSGGGFPALPILISGKVHKGRFYERTRKKAAALQRIATAMELNAEVTPENFEESALEPRYSLATLRYVRLSLTLLKKIMMGLIPGGQFVYYSTPDFDFDNRHIETRFYTFGSGAGGPDKSFTIFSKAKKQHRHF